MTYAYTVADVLEWAESYSGPKFHALLCDPPYHLTSIVKRFGKNGSKEAQGGPYRRTGKGFMGQTWDGGDVAFRPETWAAIAEHLHPGAFGMAFGSARGWHRLAVAIEDAGLIIHPSLFLGWSYGSGFPKATRIDKATGEEQWEGYRYGQQALKPALEPIILFQVPYQGRPVDSIQATGAGALWIDGGRIAVDPGGADDPRLGGGHRSGDKSQNHIYSDRGWNTGITTSSKLGRWPANLILSHAPECSPVNEDEWDCIPECPVRRLNEQSGRLKNGTLNVKGDSDNFIYGKESRPPGTPLISYGDEGGAARYFTRVSYRLDQADPVIYIAKASTAEREAGLESFPDVRSEFRPNDPDENKLQTRLHGSQARRNPHPTVKPLELAEYLAKLLLPPAAYAPRRILVPFAGVGSEMIGAGLAGWDEIQGIELQSEYEPYAQARLKHWLDSPRQLKLDMGEEQ